MRCNLYLYRIFNLSYWHAVFIFTSSFRIHNKYCTPAIEDLWSADRSRILDSSPKPLVLCGDGRMDSPGHCATFLTYVFMEYNSKKIVELQFVDCRETDLKSGNMEKLGFIRAIDALAASADVSEVITDAHPQVKSLMSKY